MWTVGKLLDLVRFQLIVRSLQDLHGVFNWTNLWWQLASIINVHQRSCDNDLVLVCDGELLVDSWLNIHVGLLICLNLGHRYMVLYWLNNHLDRLLLKLKNLVLIWIIYLITILFINLSSLWQSLLLNNMIFTFVVLFIIIKHSSNFLRLLLDSTN